MKALVTGCAGFIGSHLCEELLSLGYDVIGVDDLSAGKLDNVPDGVKFHGFDITDYNLMRYMFRNEKFDIVFNQMASKKNVCLKDPKRDCDVNARGTLLLLQLSEEFKVKKFIHASTGSVYGRYDDLIDENTRLKPCSYYGVSKLAGENYVSLYADKINCTILRYFHVYGERQDNSELGGVIAIFIKKLQDGDPLTIFGDGEQVRLFTYVKDVVKANIAAITYSGGIFNCASNEPITLHEMIKKLELNIDKEASINYEDWQYGDAKNFSIDNSLIKKELGINFTKFNDGIKFINEQDE